MSADGNTTIALHREMKDISDTTITHKSCGHAEILPAMMHNECDTQMAAIWNTTPSSSKSHNPEFQELEHPDVRPSSICVAWCERSDRNVSTVSVSWLSLLICKIASDKCRDVVPAQSMISVLCLSLFRFTKLSFESNLNQRHGVSDKTAMASLMPFSSKGPNEIHQD